MNIYIPFSVFFVTMLFIVIRLFERYKVETFPALAINYLIAALCSFMANYTVNIQNIHQSGNCFKVGFPIGLLFIIIFYLLAIVTHNSGVAIASVVSKMSVVIPIVAGVVLYNERLDALHIGGILIALVAVYLTSARVKSPTATIDFRKLILLVVFFIGSGLVDTSIKYVQANFMNSTTENLYITAIFACAGFFGMIKVIADYVDKGNTISFKTGLGGTILGVVNFLSLFFVLKALQVPGSKSAITFAIVNIGVLLTAAICGIFFFKEKFSKVNYAGFAMAIVAIVILAF